MKSLALECVTNPNRTKFQAFCYAAACFLHNTNPTMTCATERKVFVFLVAFCAERELKDIPLRTDEQKSVGIAANMIRDIWDYLIGEGQ